MTEDSLWTDWDLIRRDPDRLLELSVGKYEGLIGSYEECVGG